MNTIISLVGRTGSGKTTLSKKLARYLRTAYIEVSDVITEITNETTREGRAATASKTKKDPAWLAREVAKNIERRLEAKDRTVVVLSGIREIEVVQYLRERYDYYGFEVRAELPIRYRRALDDGKYLTADEFIRGEIRELDLGLEEVENDAPYAIPTSPLTDPDRIVRATVKLLRTKGARLR